MFLAKNKELLERFRTGEKKAMEEIWNQQHSLNDIIDEKNFKNYAELEARFNTVIAHEGKEFVGTIEESTDDPVATGE